MPSLKFPVIYPNRPASAAVADFSFHQNNYQFGQQRYGHMPTDKHPTGQVGLYLENSLLVSEKPIKNYLVQQPNQRPKVVHYFIINLMTNQN